MVRFGSKGMTCAEFVGMMRERGFTYDEDKGGFKSKNGKRVGRACRNGYRTISLQKDKKEYTFCEHRCVYVWFNGEVPDGLVINHIDFDRSNNKIENLEAITQKENVKHAVDAGRIIGKKGEESPKTQYTNVDAQAMRYLHQNGWQIKKIAELFGANNPNQVGRIIRGVRFGNVIDAGDMVSIYPAIVIRTINNNLTKEQQLHNAIMGMVGEVGEVCDIFKKHWYQGHELDYDHLFEELGDVLYYITLFITLLGWDLSDVMYNNWVKLNDRYPDGFSSERSIHREG